jgi:hypothetical protein
MAASAKETVIIVHGTWATPDPGESRWYQAFDGLDAAKSFTVRLDAALQERGSPARCWAHCTPGNQIFHWSGDNSWLARTRAASKLGDYVTKLRNQGWHVHIIAHSHSGNIVIEALPQIMAAPKSIGSPIKIVTLAACRTEVFSGVATSGMLPAIGKLAGRRAGAEAILAQVAGI